MATSGFRLYKRLKKSPKLEAIYGPLVGTTFKATYVRRWKKRGVLRVNYHTPNICEVLERVCTKLKRERKNGKPIWTGIMEDKGLFYLWVNRNPMLSRTGRFYMCQITAVDVHECYNPHHPSMEPLQTLITVSAIAHTSQQKRGTFANTTDSALATQPSLQKEIKRAYSSIIGLEFIASYVGQKQTKSTGYWRELWKVHPSSTAVTVALIGIDSGIDNDSFGGQRMSDTVWRGITRESSSYVLWVNPTKRNRSLKRYKTGCLYACKITGIEVFSNMSRKTYSNGVNIGMEATEVKAVNNNDRLMPPLWFMMVKVVIVMLLLWFTIVQIVIVMRTKAALRRTRMKAAARRILMSLLWLTIVNMIQPNNVTAMRLTAVTMVKMIQPNNVTAVTIVKTTPMMRITMVTSVAMRTTTLAKALLPTAVMVTITVRPEKISEMIVMKRGAC